MTLPLLGDLLRLRRDPLAFYEELARSEGPVARFRLGPRELVLVSTAEAFGEVLMHDLDGGWEKGAANAALRPMLGDGLFLAEGDAWKRKRRALRPLFTHERVTALEPLVREETARMLDRWRPLAASGRPFDLHAEVRRATLAVASRGIVGTDLFAQRPELGDALERMWQRLRFGLGLGGPWALALPLPGNARFRADRALVDAALREAVARRARARAEVGLDLMSVLAEPGELHDEMMTFLLTGHECGSIAVAWTSVLLAASPRVRDDVARADSPRVARDVVREAMRLYPPAWMLARTATRDRRVAGVPIPKGTIVLLSTWNVHRDPATWPDPESFRPSRFAEGAPKPARYAFAPFGVGPRTCIGLGLGMVQAEIMVTEMQRRYRITLDEAPLPDPGMTLRPRGGVRVRVAEASAAR